MNCVYEQLYKSMIGAKTELSIIEYSCINKKHQYKPFSHTSNCDSLDILTDLIIDNTVFYAFSEKEIVDLHTSVGILDDLRSAAMYAFSERLPKRMNANSDGTLGEVLLDLLIQNYEPHSQKLIARAKHTEVGKKSEITGYDALYFTKSDNGITLWLGQAKAGSETYCKSDIKLDLNTKFSSKYFADTALYISTRSSSKELTNIVNEINRMCFNAQKDKYTAEQKTKELYTILNKHKVNIKIPCLLAYTKDIYSEASLLQKEIDNLISTMSKYFEKESYTIGISLPFDIVFYIFPIKDVPYVRERIVNLKKEVVY